MRRLTGTPKDVCVHGNAAVSTNRKKGHFNMPINTRRRFGIASTAIAALLALALPVPVAHAEVTKIVVPVNQSPWVEAYKKLVADYTKETGVQVDLRVFPYDQMRSTVVTDIQSGNKTYDVYQFDEVFNHEFYGNGWVKPFKQIDPNFKMDPNIGSYGNYSYWNPTQKINDPKGDAMAFPLNGNFQLFLYRKDIYQTLGLKVPNTWDEVLANAKKIKDAGLELLGAGLLGRAAPLAPVRVGHAAQPTPPRRLPEADLGNARARIPPT